MCRRKTPGGEFCQVCGTAFNLKGVLVAAPYQNKLLQKTIHTYKYRFAEDLALPLSEILIEAILINKRDCLKTNFCHSEPFASLKACPEYNRRNKLREESHDSTQDCAGFFGLRPQNNSLRTIWSLENTVLIPVPLHKKRYLWRGFNQAELLAKEIGKRFNLPVLANVLSRTKNTTPQTQLNILERKENIQSAFSCLRPELIFRKNILLIDDVCTSGATLEECAKALSCGQPGKIWGLVLAKG